MKGVVLSGGKGTRLRPITFAMAKQLVPVGNQPILFYGLRDLAAAGIKDVAIVVSPETGDEVRRAVGDGQALGIEPTFIVQPEPNGLAAALRLALPWVGDDSCVMYLGDNLVKGGVADIVSDFERDGPNCQIMLSPVDRPQDFGVAELDAEGRIVRLVEKPTDPPSNLALVGVYLFDRGIGEAIDSISPSARGEYEITDAIQYLIRAGRDVRASIVRHWWKDTGRKDDLLHANELILEDIEHDVRGKVVATAIEGPVRIGDGTRVVHSEITGPVVIGSGTTIQRAVIGPNTTIGDGCHLSDCAIENSIVMEGAEVRDWRVRDSLLGRRAIVRGPAPAGYVPLTLGEHSEIGTS